MSAADHQRVLEARRWYTGQTKGNVKGKSYAAKGSVKDLLNVHGTTILDEKKAGSGKSATSKVTPKVRPNVRLVAARRAFQSALTAIFVHPAERPFFVAMK